MTNRTAAAMESAMAMRAKAIMDAKQSWLDTQMKRLLPPDLYVLAEQAKEKASSRKKLMRWIEKEKVTINEYQPQAESMPNGDGKLPPSLSRTVLSRDGQPISEFAIRSNDGKLEVLTRDFPLPEPEKEP
jgi:hypothetical protein